MINFLKQLFHTNKKGKKLGLALGSGGAKGMAHIGALRAFEEEGITFDVVSGCSIGSIIGGFYALGISTPSMRGLIDEVGICEPTRLIKYKLQGLTTQKLLDQMMGGADIEELNLPYGAVAVDINSGEEVWLTSGNLARACCASSAIPPFFKPVTIDNKRLVDGAFKNGVPANLAKSLGADVVIAIDLCAERPNNFDIKRVLDELYKNNKIPPCDRSSGGYDYCDFMLKPALSGYSAVGCKNLDQMEQIGYLEAKSKMPQIKAMLTKKMGNKFNFKK